MSFEIKVTKNFEKEAKPLAKKYSSFKGDIAQLIKELLLNPQSGTSLGHGLYKIRVLIKSKSGGKSGGARVITYVILKNEVIHLLSIYDKGEHDTAKVETLIQILKGEGL